MAQLAILFPGLSTQRSRQDMAYCFRALAVLNDDPAFAWLYATKQTILQRTSRMKSTILAALGRIEDEAELREAAALVCKRKPKTNHAVILLRRWRLGKTRPVKAVELTNALIRCLNDYLTQYPETTWPQVWAALAEAADAVEQSGGGT
jgi:hypothetical protein